jgi:hypothetical protein
MGLFIAGAAWLFPTPEAQHQAASAPSAPGPGATAPTHPAAMDQWGTSPFGKGAPQQESDAVRVARRRAKMAAGHYPTPPAYDAMGLAQLQARVKQGDVFAMVQLGERFASERDALEHDPDFPADANPNLLARHYFTLAIGRGYSQLPSLLADAALEKGDVADAYAWHLVAAKYNDTGAAFQQRKAALAQLDQGQQQAALKHYEKLSSALNFP